MIVSQIAAMSENHVIGKDNQLLWHMPNDLKHFKNTTAGHTVIIGRKTFESIGNKPLPKRRNIIVTRQNISFEGCEVVHSVEAAIALCKGEDEVFIIGGAEIYKVALPLTNRIYLTIIHYNFDGDAFFPEIDKNEWKEVSHENHPADEKHAYSYSFIMLERA